MLEPFFAVFSETTGILINGNGNDGVRDQNHDWLNEGKHRAARFLVLSFGRSLPNYDVKFPNLRFERQRDTQ